MAEEAQEVIAALSPLLAEAAAGNGRLPPERALAERLGIPRRQLRLALDELARRGVLFRRRGQGTFVAPPPPAERARPRLLAGRLSLAQLMDVRRQIEPRLAELAALNVSPQDLPPLEALMRRTREAGSPADYDRADEVFHYRIAELADNTLFLQIYDLIRQTRRESGWRDLRAEVNRPEILAQLGAQHGRIFAAIAAGDARAAGLAQRGHMDFVAATIKAG